MNIGVLVASIVLFSYGDAVGKGKTGNGTFDLFGVRHTQHAPFVLVCLFLKSCYFFRQQVFLIAVGVCADSLTSNYEGPLAYFGQPHFVGQLLPVFLVFLLPYPLMYVAKTCAEMHLFKVRNASHSEVMMAASLFGSAYMCQHFPN
jgi:hypothetical protein